MNVWARREIFEKDQELFHALFSYAQVTKLARLRLRPSRHVLHEKKGSRWYRDGYYLPCVESLGDW
jgi:hypothetical protein